MKMVGRGGAGKCPFGGDGKCVIPASTEALQIPFVGALNLEAELEGLPAIIGLCNACTAVVRINPFVLLTFVWKGRG